VQTVHETARLGRADPCLEVARVVDREDEDDASGGLHAKPEVQERTRVRAARLLQEGRRGQTSKALFSFPSFRGCVAQMPLRSDASTSSWLKLFITK
jgi:hypothetical protein